MKAQRLLNPFNHIAGARALLYGLAVIVVTSVLAYFKGLHFDGTLDVHFGSKQNLLYHFTEQLSIVICNSAVFYCCGLVVSRSRIRLVDIAGTMALSRWPMLLVALVALLPIEQPVISQQEFHIDPWFFFQAFLMLVCTVWMVILMYHAYVVSTNAKRPKAGWSFGLGIVAAEVITKVIFYLL